MNDRIDSSAPFVTVSHGEVQYLLLPVCSSSVSIGRSRSINPGRYYMVALSGCFATIAFVAVADVLLNQCFVPHDSLEKRLSRSTL